MTKQTSDALRRADRALVGALLVALSFSAGIVLGHNAPSTEQVASVTKQVTHATVQLAHASRQSAANLVLRTSYATADAIAAFPVSAASITRGFIDPVRTVTTVPSAAQMTLIRILQDQRCLAEAMYYEARGEGRSGQEAIAEVVFHRMRAPGYPHSICGVVYQGAGNGHGCQFSFACNGKLQEPKTAAAWYRARTLAAKIMAGVVPLGDITGDAISFHAADVQPEWADRLEKTIQIGNHVFYRAAARTKSS